MKSPEYDEYLFDKHMELYDVSPVNSFSWHGLLEHARTLSVPALFLIRSDIGKNLFQSYIIVVWLVD